MSEEKPRFVFVTNTHDTTKMYNGKKREDINLLTCTELESPLTMITENIVATDKRLKEDIDKNKNKITNHSHISYGLGKQIVNVCKTENCKILFHDSRFMVVNIDNIPYLIDEQKVIETKKPPVPKPLYTPIKVLACTIYKNNVYIVHPKNGLIYVIKYDIDSGEISSSHIRKCIKSEIHNKLCIYANDSFVYIISSDKREVVLNVLDKDKLTLVQSKESKKPFHNHYNVDNDLIYMLDTVSASEISICVYDMKLNEVTKYKVPLKVEKTFSVVLSAVVINNAVYYVRFIDGIYCLYKYCLKENTHQECEIDMCGEMSIDVYDNNIFIY
jgi:hypothetical protein